MRATVLCLAGALAVAAVTTPATASSKRKPITKTYQATAVAPDPTNAVGGDYETCAMAVPGSFDKRAFKAPAAGKLVVDLTDFQVDWDLLVIDAKGTQVGTSGNGGYGTPVDPSSERATVKVKKPGTYYIVACNWAGTPTATVKYTFTFS